MERNSDLRHSTPRSGPSHLGYARWAIAPFAPDLKAMATQVTASQFRDAAYVGGSFALESTGTTRAGMAIILSHLTG